MTTKEKVRKATWELSKAVDHAMRLPALWFFSHLHAFLGNSSLQTLRGDRILKRNAIRELQFTAPAFPTVFAPHSREAVELVDVERLAVRRRKFIELGDKGGAVHTAVTSADVGLSLENHPLLVYRARASRLGSVHPFSVEKRKQSSLTMTTGPQSKKVTRTSLDDGVKVAAKSVAA